MKTHPLLCHALALIPFGLVAVSCETTPLPPSPKSSSAVAIKEGVPGGVVVNTTEYTARVTSVDSDNRKVTLQRSDGQKFTVKAGPEIVNFDQIKTGDLIKATVTEELVIHVHEGGAVPPDSGAAAVLLAPKGAKPGAIAAGTVTVVGTVTAIDQQARTATVQFEDGTKKTFAVRQDIDLTKQKTGTKVVFQVTEMVAIRVEKP